MMLMFYLSPSCSLVGVFVPRAKRVFVVVVVS